MQLRRLLENKRPVDFQVMPGGLDIWLPMRWVKIAVCKRAVFIYEKSLDFYVKLSK